MNYADIKQCDAANGPGIRISLFVSGCTHRCKGCFNEVAWDFNYGSLFTQNEIDRIIDYLSPSYIAVPQIPILMPPSTVIYPSQISFLYACTEYSHKAAKISVS